MGMWPFFRRNRSRKRSLNGGSDISRSEDETMHHAPPLWDEAQSTEMNSAASGPDRRRSRRDARGKRRSSKEPKKLQRNPEQQRKYSFSPGQLDTIQIPHHAHHHQHNNLPVPPIASNFTAGATRASTNARSAAPVNQPAMNTEDWQRAPTLHKRSAQDFNRRKSSKKRRKEEHDREAEIKAMANSIPTRPATDSMSSGRPIKRESKKLRLGLNHNLQNPSFDISLPTAESMRSSLSSKSAESTSYKLSTLNVLAPRPTIRFAENPNYGPGASGFGLKATESKRKRISERTQIPLEVLKANKRVDELADDLDAGDLRELMERDQRRKEKKIIADRIKMEKRLARRQEKQRAEEAEAARTGASPPLNLERGVLGREVVGLGIEKGTSAVVTSSKRRGSDLSMEDRPEPSGLLAREESKVNVRDPHAHFQSTASLATEDYSPTLERQEYAFETARAGKMSRASISPPPSPRDQLHDNSNIAEVLSLSKTPSNVPEDPFSVKRTSESPARPPQSWASFFRRGSRAPKRGSIQSSFSNTSRESAARESSQTAQTPQRNYTPIKLASSVPRRTMSKFREDLPELPLSPPNSRVQSPEADDVPPIKADYPKAGQVSSDVSDPRVRYDTPISNYQSIDATRLRDETPVGGHRSSYTASPEPNAIMSQSLASIDSEGSWLSGGRGSKRGSHQMVLNPLRDSASSLQRRYREFSESAEELGIAEDEYFSRLTPGPDEHFGTRRSSVHSTGEPMASSDEEDDAALSPKLGAVARRPTVIHREARAKSREVVLQGSFEENGNESADGRSGEPVWKDRGMSEISD